MQMSKLSITRLSCTIVLVLDLVVDALLDVNAVHFMTLHVAFAVMVVV